MTGCLSDDAEILNSVLCHNFWPSKTSALLCFLDKRKSIKVETTFNTFKKHLNRGACCISLLLYENTITKLCRTQIYQQ